MLQVVDLELEVGVLDQLLEASETQPRRLLHRLAFGLLAVVNEDSVEALVLVLDQLQNLLVRAVRQPLQIDLAEHLIFIRRSGAGARWCDHGGRLLFHLGLAALSCLWRALALWRCRLRCHHHSQETALAQATAAMCFRKSTAALTRDTTQGLFGRRRVRFARSNGASLR